MKTVLRVIIFLLACQTAFAQSENEYYAEVMNQHSFEKYPVDIKCKVGATADSLKWGSLKDLPTQIKTNILTQFKSNDSFIGSCYKYAIWGCGSPCQMLAVFRISSGQLVGTLNASSGFSIQSSSRLIIKNPPTEQEMDLEVRKNFGEPQFYELRNGVLTEIQ